MIEDAPSAPSVRFRMANGRAAIVTPDRRGAVVARPAAPLADRAKRIEAGPAIHAAIPASSRPRISRADAVGRGIETAAGFVHARLDTPWYAAIAGLTTAWGMIATGKDARSGLPGSGAAARRCRRPSHRRGIAARPRQRIGRPMPRAHHLGMIDRLALPGPVAAGGAISVAGDTPAAGPHDGAGRTIADERLAARRLPDGFREGPRAFREKRAPACTGRRTTRPQEPGMTDRRPPDTATASRRAGRRPADGGAS